ncbi:fibronectin type III domain protein [Acidiphilium sp. CAG:727]|nr:fibronectin type III domain protein [Acidiphilium sp. CAG:727]
MPADANYTVTLTYVHKVKDGQTIKLWEKDDASLPWSRVETQFVEQNVAYRIRVRFKTNDGYKLIRNAAQLRSNMQVLGAELGKGKDIEIWDSAGMNSISTIVDMDFLITRGMTYIGNIQTVYPEIGKSKTGTIGTESVDTGFFISGAPAPYTYKAKIAPIGMEIQTSNVFDKSNCYYQITAVNSMDYGTMYITATAANGKTCDIPVKIAAVSGGHEHTWSDFRKIDFEHHGYTKCTDPACPGVAPAFDKGSQYAVHEFVGGCTEKCTTCGNLNNPNAKHNLKFVAETPATCIAGGMKAHYTCEGCGKFFDEDKNGTTEAAGTIPATGAHN